MSFSSNIGKPWVVPTTSQCEMLNFHHPDCGCDSCIKYNRDVQCLEPAVGVVEDWNCRVCEQRAQEMENEDFTVVRF